MYYDYQILNMIEISIKYQVKVVYTRVLTYNISYHFANIHCIIDIDNIKSTFKMGRILSIIPHCL